MKFLDLLFALNRGLVSTLALARIDLKRLALSAEVMTNWLPRVLGSMALRPGLQYLGGILGDKYSTSVEFVFGVSDSAAIELTDAVMRVRVNDVLVSRPAVAAVYGDWNGAAYVNAGKTTSTFLGGDLAFWHQNDEAGATSGVAADNTGVSLVGTGLARAIRDRQIIVAVADQGKEHSINLSVYRGRVEITIGSTEGIDDYLETRTLRAGNHSIAITPAATFYVRFTNYRMAAGVVSYVQIMVLGGPMQVITPWGSNAQLDGVRYDQSGDVIFVACAGMRPQRIERQDRLNTPASRSWSVCDFAPEDGPFGNLNTGPVQLTPGALSGQTTLTSSIARFFKSTHVGALFRLTSAGQEVDQQINGANVFSNPILVTGVGAARSFQIVLTAVPTFTNTTTVTLQRSIATPGIWTDVGTFTVVTNAPVNDLLDNQIIYYRIGVKTGQFTAMDGILAKLIYSAGSIDGICRVASVVSDTVANVSVLKAFGGLNATQNWYEGDWSPRKGFPTSVVLFGGRSFWAGKGLWWGSASDLFDSFDDNAEGDGATIRGTMGNGPVDTVNWLLSLNHLLLGAEGEAQVAQASSIVGPLTPTDRSLKTSTTKGTAPLRALKQDTNGIFVSRNASRVFELSADASLYSVVPYVPTDLTELVPELGAQHGGWRRIAIQNAKDTRVHCVGVDGVVGIMVRDKTEKVDCWLEIHTTGIVEDVIVLPGAGATPTEDQVYYTVKRIINGVTKRFFEKWALDAQAVGAADNRMADACIVGNAGGPTGTLAAAHLPNTQVSVWGNGKDLGLATTDGSGNVTVPGGVLVTGPWCVGLAYTGQWKSAKLAVGSQAQVPLTQLKLIQRIGLVMQQTHARGLQYGTDFAGSLRDLPSIEFGQVVDPNSIWAQYDAVSMPLEGSWDTDPRLCLQAQSPRPVTVLAVVLSGEGHDRI